MKDILGPSAAGGGKHVLFPVFFSVGETVTINAGQMCVSPLNSPNDVSDVRPVPPDILIKIGALQSMKRNAQPYTEQWLREQIGNLAGFRQGGRKLPDGTTLLNCLFQGLNIELSPSASFQPRTNPHPWPWSPQGGE